MANTRKTLERVPDDKFAWKPHEKSMSLGGLATHLANIPSWTAQTFDRDELDIAPPGEPPLRMAAAKTREDFPLRKETRWGCFPLVRLAGQTLGQKLHGHHRNLGPA